MRKVQRREISAKNHREAEKAGVAPPPSPETSVSEIEGGGGNADWLDELMEEDDMVPSAGGGTEVPEGSKARGESEVPEETQVPGADRSSPTSSWTTRTLHLGRARPPWAPRGGEGVGGRI